MLVTNPNANICLSKVIVKVISIPKNNALYGDKENKRRITLCSIFKNIYLVLSECFLGIVQARMSTGMLGSHIHAGF